jgi:site-specific recombinase XerD
VSSKPLLKHFKVPVDEVTSALIERFKVKRLKECSAAGVNRELAALRFMLNFAIRQGYIRTNPVRRWNSYRKDRGTCGSSRMMRRSSTWKPHSRI